jgi:hypothetical protein
MPVYRHLPKGERKTESSNSSKELSMKTCSIVRASIHPGLFRLLSVWVIALLIVGLVFSAQPALGAQAAVQATCTSTASGDWSADIWSCPGGPGSGDDVVIAHDVDLSTNKTVHSLSINAFGLLAFRAPVTLTLSGDMSVDVDGIFDPGNDTDATGGTVVLSGLSQTINSDGKWIDFYNLSKTAAVPSSLAFSPALSADDGVHILNDVVLKGTSPATFLSLVSSTPGSEWQIQVDKSLDIDYVAVQDSNNVSPGINQPINVEHGNDLGSNTGWTFTTLVTAVTLTSSENPGIVGRPVIFTASVSPTSATGTVTFFQDNDDIATCINVPVVAGKATCSVTFAQRGEESMTASFNADGLLADSTSSPLIQVIAIKIFAPSIFK